MARLADQGVKVRSKNAGPFWLTIDVFCGNAETFQRIRALLRTEDVARLFGQPTQLVRRFEISDLAVIKLSFPRPVVQGSSNDRDMHGAQYAILLAEMELSSE
jgi:hypothetical protein